MKMLTATRVAALAVGLSLVGGMALAAPDGRRGNNDNTAAEEQEPNDQDGRRDRSRRNTKPDVNQAPVVNQTVPATSEAVPPNQRQRRDARRARNPGDVSDNGRGRNDQANDRTRSIPTPVVTETERRRNYGDRNDRRNWGNQDRRRQVNVQQHRRNFNAPRRYRIEAYRWRDGNSYRRYHYGQRLPRHYFLRNFWLANFFNYGLFEPPPGYIWVRYGPDALLIDEYTGEIVQVRYNMFYS